MLHYLRFLFTLACAVSWWKLLYFGLEKSMNRENILKGLEFVFPMNEKRCKNK